MKAEETPKGLEGASVAGTPLALPLRRGDKWSPQKETYLLSATQGHHYAGLKVRLRGYLMETLAHGTHLVATFPLPAW